eukprot:gene35195-biopygen27332
MKRLTFALISGVLLSACATSSTFYQAAAGPNATGYSEYRIEPGRYRFTFRGDPAMTTTIEVLMGRGERPRGQDTYDARALRQTLGARI